MSKRISRLDSSGGKHEHFATPPWCVDRLLEWFEGHALGTQIQLATQGVKRWLEPAAGTGAIIRTVNAKWPGIKWTACEVRPSCEKHLAKLLHVRPEEGKSYSPGHVVIGDFFTFVPAKLDYQFDVAWMNPPFSMCQEFVSRSRAVAPFVICLTRINWLASFKRREWFMAGNMPRWACILPDRPSFTRDGRTDGTEYAWMIWDALPCFATTTVILNTTPLEVRQSYYRKRRRLGKAA